MILRPISQDQYSVIGECYVHGLADSAAILGPVPADWTVRVEWDDANLPVYHFYNTLTEKISDEDPRLGPLPRQWKNIQSARSLDDPELFQKYKNEITGEIINCDPRLFPDALEQQGVNLKRIQLV
jgi:hypothetical protein